MKNTTLITLLISIVGITFTSCGNSQEKSDAVETTQDSSNISQTLTGGYMIVGLEHSGDYHKITSKLDELKSFLKEKGDDSTKLVAVYFDDEATVKEAELKSFAGFVVKDSAEAATMIAANSKFKMHSVAKKNGFYVDAPFSNWENLIQINGDIYNNLMSKITESNGKIAQKEAAIEEYTKNSVRFILQID